VIGAGELASSGYFSGTQSSSLPLHLVALCVTQNALDVNHPPPVFDGGNQPEAIMAYIENDEAPHNI